jgi:ribosomal protein S27AE
MIETEVLLEKCPSCGAWPMAAKLPKASSPQREIRLKCRRCGYEEGARLRTASSARSASQQRTQQR